MHLSQNEIYGAGQVVHRCVHDEAICRPIHKVFEGFMIFFVIFHLFDKKTLNLNLIDLYSLNKIGS